MSEMRFSFLSFPCSLEIRGGMVGQFGTWRNVMTNEPRLAMSNLEMEECVGEFIDCRRERKCKLSESDRIAVGLLFDSISLMFRGNVGGEW